MIFSLIVLIVAAALECTGDGLIRRGLQPNLLLFIGGALLLTAYGVVVNQGVLNFGRLMGVYIAVFFLVSQLIAFLLFRDIPAPRTILGGLLIVAGGLIILV